MPAPLSDADLLTLTVPQLLRIRARETPVNLALSARSIGGWRDRLTYAQLVDRMERMGQALHAAGIRPDDRIAIFLTNAAGRECFLTALGALRLGAAVSPINTRGSDEDIAHALDLLEPALIVTDASGAERLGRLRPASRFMIAGAEARGMEVWPDPEHVACDASEPPPEPADPNVTGCLLFTSGTTARSKAVLHSHSTMIGAGLSCARALGLAVGDLYQGGWPFFTSSGLNLGGMSSWVAGAGLVFEEPLDNAGRLRLIAAERSTFYHGVPSVVHFIVEEYAKGGFDVSSLRRVGYGGSAMPADVVRRIAERWPHVEQVEIFGMTESGPSGTVLPPEERLRRFGAIGRAMPHCEVLLVDDTLREVPAGETGEIFIRGPGVARGYFRNPDATREAFVGGGIRTGDLGRRDADGFLHYADRRKDIINRGGLKIASVAVEEVLYRHPAIREAAVIAVPHPALGEDVAAVVVAAPGRTIDTDELAGFCAGLLADYACPRHWRVLEELPKNPMGKVLKRDLRAMFAADGIAAQ